MLLSFACSVAEAEPRLQYVTTAEQHGIVGYRDPIGVISPDGRWLAYSEGRFLKMQLVDGGPVLEFEPLKRDIRYIAWLPDSRHVAIPDRSHASEPTRWFVYSIGNRQNARLWPGLTAIVATDAETGEERSVSISELQQLTWSPDGDTVVGLQQSRDGTSLWTMNAEGGEAHVQSFDAHLSYPVLHGRDNRIACLHLGNSIQRLRIDCADGTSAWPDDREVYGPVAFSGNGDTVYYATPDDRGTLDLWSQSRSGGQPLRLTGFERDAYAPTVDERGRVLFKVQDYRPVLAMAPAGGGPTSALTTFMSETPSWDWTGKQIGFTYGNWRRAVDDFRYPDIAQDVGIIDLGKPIPASKPDRIVSASTSEDQGQNWSPNGRWIAFHSHFGPSDDIWLVPADQSEKPRQLTEGTHEAGWPRWSADGDWLVYTGQKGETASSRMFVLGMDQDSGEIVDDEQEVPLQNFAGDVGHAEWGGDSRHLVFEAIPEPGRKAIYRVDRTGGVPELVHAFDCEEKYSGIGVSPDGRWVAFIAPGPRGHRQVYRVSTEGGDPQLVTSDPTNKTHPAFSPDGGRIAFTVWRYEAHFWLLVP